MSWLLPLPCDTLPTPVAAPWVKVAPPVAPAPYATEKMLRVM
jgi:hypothetical protein